MADGLVDRVGALRRVTTRDIALGVAKLGPVVVLVILASVAAIAIPNFATRFNLVNLSYQAAIFIVLGVGMTFVITGGGIDLSIGSQVALVAVLMASWIQTYGFPVWLAVVCAILLGMALGTFNGVLIGFFRIPDFIVTLAAMETFRGLALVHSAGKIWFDFPVSLRAIGLTRILGVPFPVYLALFVAVIGGLVYHFTFFGRHTIAIGGNWEAAKLAGVATRKYKILTYTVMGALCGIGAVMYTARLDSAQATMATNYEIHVIATVIMGGTSLFGGHGSQSGTVVGALILAIIANTMVLRGVPFFWRLVATGIIIVVAVLLNMWRERVLRSE